MGWKETDRMSLRSEFVELFECGGVSVAELCRRFGISRKTGYKWAARAREYRALGEARLTPRPDQAAVWSVDRSRRPKGSPARTDAETEKAILAVREVHGAWGGRKIARRLRNQGMTSVPAPSTITEVLRRHGLISKEESAARRALIRFEREEPNALWQMDFKGHFAVEDGSRCHPLVVIDDCSRYLVALEAHGFERDENVRKTLTTAFRTHGIPFEMLMDNGSVWGSTEVPARLSVWLMRLGIRVKHGRIYHPQTQGKCERFNRSLKAEVLGDGARFASQGDSQKAFDRFRQCYNHERPHEALGLDVPSSHYRTSPVPFPEELPPINYLEGDLVRLVGSGGGASLHNHVFLIGKAFVGERVAFRPTKEYGIYDVYFCHTYRRRVDLRNPDFTKYVRKSTGTVKSKTTAVPDSR